MLLVLPLLALAACDDGWGVWGVGGTYQLEAVNGRNIPAVVFERVGRDDFQVAVVNGELRLRGDNSFRLDIMYRETEPGTETEYGTSLAGRWERHDDLVVLEYVDPGTGRWWSMAAVPRNGSLEFSLPAAGVGVGMRVLFER
jgi:hypothetical protein